MAGFGFCGFGGFLGLARSCAILSVELKSNFRLFCEFGFSRVSSVGDVGLCNSFGGCSGRGDVHKSVVDDDNAAAGVDVFGFNPFAESERNNLGDMGPTPLGDIALSLGDFTGDTGGEEGVGEGLEEGVVEGAVEVTVEVSTGSGVGTLKSSSVSKGFDRTWNFRSLSDAVVGEEGGGAEGEVGEGEGEGEEVDVVTGDGHD